MNQEKLQDSKNGQGAGNAEKSIVLQELEILEKFLQESPEHEIQEAAGYICERLKINIEKIQNTDGEHLASRFNAILKRVSGYIEALRFSEPESLREERIRNAIDKAIEWFAAGKMDIPNNEFGLELDNTLSDLLKTDRGLIKERNLGSKKGICRVCGVSGEYLSWRIKEMMIPTRDEFEYFCCHNCNCLQIRDVPENTDKYYRHDYYSYKEPRLTYMAEGTFPKPHMVLDVGCGVGKWLCELPAQGYTNLYGCDPYIEKDLRYDNGVFIKKSTIHDIVGHFDYIRLCHSFEHMADPHNVIKSIKRLLKPTGSCHISIPVFPNIAFAIYGPFWYQADAPRHFFLHSRESIIYLTRLSGLSVSGIMYNSNKGQFSHSRLYQLDIPFWKQLPEVTKAEFTWQDIENMNLMAKIANEKNMGDMAVFELRHSEI